jgi:CTP-dependent riboflavin kinase
MKLTVKQFAKQKQMSDQSASRKLRNLRQDGFITIEKQKYATDHPLNSRRGNGRTLVYNIPDTAAVVLGLKA